MNGICKIDLEGQEIAFLFGMKAMLIFSEKYGKEIYNSGGVDKVDAFKLFTYVVYAGLCNRSESLDNEYPSFEHAYYLSEKLNFYNPDLAVKVMNTFNESRATKEVLERLNPKQSSDTETVKKKKKVI